MDEGDAVPEGLFDIVTKIIFLARRVTDRVDTLCQQNRTGEPGFGPVTAAPSEDLTAYPQFRAQKEETAS